MAKIKDFKPIFIEENGVLKIYWTKKDKINKESPTKNKQTKSRIHYD